jgi:hypothetical protein
VILWICFYLALSLCSAAVLWPMLRAPRMQLHSVAAPLFPEVPVTTFDSKGFV